MNGMPRLAQAKSLVLPSGPGGATFHGTTNHGRTVMKITVESLFSLQETLQELLTDNDGHARKMPFTVVYHIRKFVKDLSREAEAIEPERLRILKAHCAENGKRFDIAALEGEAREAFFSEWVPFLAEELDVKWSWQPLTLKQMEAVDVTSPQIDVLVQAGVVTEEEPDALH